MNSGFHRSFFFLRVSDNARILRTLQTKTKSEEREREMQIDGLRRRRTSTANHVPTSAESDQGPPANRKTKSSLHRASTSTFPFSLPSLAPTSLSLFLSSPAWLAVSYSLTASFLLSFYESSSILLSVSGPIDRATWEKAHGARGFRSRERCLMQTRRCHPSHRRLRIRTRSRQSSHRCRQCGNNRRMKRPPSRLAAFHSSSSRA